MEYRVVYSSRVDRLIEDVNKLLSDGWSIREGLPVQYVESISSGDFFLLELVRQELNVELVN